MGDQAERVFESNLIPIDGYSGLMDDNYDDFLKRRAELILQKIKLFTSPEPIEIAPRLATQVPLKLDY